MLEVIERSTRWSGSTKRVYRQAVQLFFQSATEMPSGRTLELWRDGLLVQGRQAVTVHKLMAAVKAVAKRRAQLLGVEDFAHAAELPAVRAWSPKPAPDIAAASALLDTCARDRSPRGLRDLVILRLAAIATGARRSEIEQLAVGDVRGHILHLRRKGGWVQEVPLDEKTESLLRAWLKWRKGGDSDRMFVAIARGLLDQYRPSGPLTGAGIARMLKRRSIEAGLRSPIRPHSLRRFFISSLFEAGEPAHRIMLACGHRSLATTSRYVTDIRGDGPPPGEHVAALMNMLGRTTDPAGPRPRSKRGK
jgi:integrase